MKIVIIGYSGSGKSTLAEKLSKKYNIALLHLDKIHFLANWQERKLEDEQRLLKNFLNENKSGWVIDGNYSKNNLDRRLEEADKIIFMNFNRINCLFRAAKRYLLYRGKTRSSIAENCPEKFDLEFIKWILLDGRTKQRKNSFLKIVETYKEKTIILKNQKDIDKYLLNL